MVETEYYGPLASVTDQSSQSVVRFNVISNCIHFKYWPPSINIHQKLEHTVRPKIVIPWFNNAYCTKVPELLKMVARFSCKF